MRQNSGNVAKIFGTQITFDMFCALKSLKVKLKAISEFPNVWGEYKNHSNPYIQGTTVPCDMSPSDTLPYMQNIVISPQRYTGKRKAGFKGHQFFHCALRFSATRDTTSSTDNHCPPALFNVGHWLALCVSLYP